MTVNQLSKIDVPFDPHAKLHKLAIADLLGLTAGQDFELGHNFYVTAQGVRFTVCESARREVLSRLLRLNHERWEEEQKVTEGEAQKAIGGKPKKVTRKKNVNAGQERLL